MTPTELLKRLEAEGVGVSLNLKLEADTKPSDDTRALIRDNRDALLEHLIAQAKRTHVSDVGTMSTRELQTDKNAEPADMSASSYFPRVGSLHLYGDLLHSLMVWVARYYELRLEHPGGINLDAKPDHVTGALTRYPWGVVYTAECHVLLSWGDVPRHALTDKTELQPTAQAPVTAERVVN